MASIEFRIKPHAMRPSESVCEIWQDGRFVACLYPGNDGYLPDADLRFISSHLLGSTEVSNDSGTGVIFSWRFR